MRELVVENQRVLIIPQNFRYANQGTVKSVEAGEFVLELDNAPEGMMINTYCEFYTQTKRGKLYFDSFAKKIEGNIMVIASPAKHKFLQRRQYTRIKYVTDTQMYDSEKNSYQIKTLDVSAGGLKLISNQKFDIDTTYFVSIPVSETKSVDCEFHPIRIEKKSDSEYTVSGQFAFSSSHERMILVQYCAKRNVEIKKSPMDF